MASTTFPFSIMRCSIPRFFSSIAADMPHGPAPMIIVSMCFIVSTFLFRYDQLLTYTQRVGSHTICIHDLIHIFTASASVIADGDPVQVVFSTHDMSASACSTFLHLFV